MLAEALAILVMLGVLSVLIIVHEAGHYTLARLFGFQTPVFGFGLPFFGPYAVIGKRWGTEFRIHALLLGGYVAIPELGDETNAREENYGVPLKPFRKFPIWQRALVAFAGVGNNIIFAWLIMFFMLAFMGEPTQPTVVTRLPAENPIAAQAGIKVGDKITGIDSIKVESPDDIVHYLTVRPETKVVVHVLRKPEAAVKAPAGARTPDQPVDITVTTNNHGKVGMELMSRGEVHYRAIHKNPVELAQLTTTRLTRMTQNMLDALGMMFQGIFTPHEHAKHVAGAPPKLGLEDMHGLLMVIAIGADIAQQDWSQLLLFTIYISLDLAIINLMPWPALDGFHLAAMGLEAVRGKPMEERAQGELMKWGIISLLVLMALITVNDLRSLIKGEFSLKKIEQRQQQEEPVKKPPDNTGTPSSPASAPAPK
jgi:regulator of sigma E protease